MVPVIPYITLGVGIVSLLLLLLLIWRLRPIEDAEEVRVYGFRPTAPSDDGDDVSIGGSSSDDA